MGLAHMSMWRHSRHTKFSAKVQKLPQMKTLRTSSARLSIEMWSEGENLQLSIILSSSLKIISSCNYTVLQYTTVNNSRLKVLFFAGSSTYQ